MPDKPRDLPVLSFPSAQAWEAWLAERPADAKGVWLRLAKKGSGIAGPSKQEAIDGALCHGWIDGQIDRGDATSWLTRFTPRKAGSRWSENNRSRALALIAEGRMQAAGFGEIERAKADGRWDAAYASQGRITVPDDLQAALDADEAASRFFAGLDSANRYAVLYRIHHARTPQARARQIETSVAMLARGETFHPRRGKPKA
ncbi:YdeI/OmpD-associated family protein [Labrys wisconsinensis]|uniref:Uncharacterized protein YdeI (YjbR/CyaY-like superfamily) n=1 Tax=Labrys wisconsinensis TaxID=425677 RepID=A0ABU0JL18_9HYPH|nr:YdeI/OmpD-associated family protein [Labrys wisconsinensis]MDQ0474968.1 uncharacterized protein YdeI (YjbR/CyaY-like superfamily) [Labrys wisconsinensis]